MTLSDHESQLDPQTLQTLPGATVYSAAGEDKIGTVGQVYLDDTTGQPEFISVNTGLFGMRESFVPLSGASVQGDRVLVPWDKDVVKDAPNVDADSGHLDEDEERRLYEHYSLPWTSTSGTMPTSADPMDTLATETTAGTTGYDTSGPTTDEAMTRSEERLVAGTRTEEAGRARLRKYVVTETETIDVPVQKERAYVTREPIDASNVDEATSGPEISEEEHEVILHEEHAVAGTVTEPVERVRLGTETTTETETVSEEVRKEQIETEGDVDDQRS